MIDLLLLLAAALPLLGLDHGRSVEQEESYETLMGVVEEVAGEFDISMEDADAKAFVVSHKNDH